MQLTPEHEQIRDTVRRWVAQEVNPHVDAWEAEEIFPAHQVFGQMGRLGLLGLNKPVEDGGLGLDYSYAAVLAEAIADIDCGGIPMAIGVQTDMCTPALAQRGSAELRAEFLAPAIRESGWAASACPRSAVARTWPPSGPRRAATAATT